PPAAGLAPPQTNATAAPTAPPRTDGPCAGLKSPLPAPPGHVGDFANVIDEDVTRRLEEKLARLKRQGNVELAVVTVETTAGEDINDYSLAVACGWGVGPPESEPGGGIVLLLAVKDRRWRVQVSERLRPDLPDDAVKEIGDRMNPHFRAGDYARGLDACVDGLIARLAEKRNFKPE
ncbi:MAG TPA: TPM domain-containing protein, partial [Pyrinomonadaceae bacterium]|nr:TPM domain-containing protein [Pyrinomonadaceae bacterium]